MCGCVMECTAWHFSDDVGDVKGTGDFDCRNCDNVISNQIEGVVKIPNRYSSSLFESLDSDLEFSDFVDQFEDEIEFNTD